MAGYRFTVLSPDVDESAQGLSPDLLVQELSQRKAAAAAVLSGSDNVILAADTVVALDAKSSENREMQPAQYKCFAPYRAEPT